MALDPQFPTDALHLRPLHARRGDRRHGAALGHAGVTSDPARTRPAATSTAASSPAGSRASTPSGRRPVLVDDWCQQYPSHSQGQLQFGPDGALYASSGDGAAFSFADWGQDGSPVNPCGDPPGGVGGALTPPTAEGGACARRTCAPTGDPVGLDGTLIRVDPDNGAALPDEPARLEPGPERAADRRCTDCAIRSASPSGRARPRCGSATSASDAGRRSTASRTCSGRSRTAAGPATRARARPPSFEHLDLNLCESLYAAGPSAVSAPVLLLPRTPGRSSAARRAPRRAARSRASPSTRAGRTRPPTAARSSSPTTRATASGRCGRARTGCRTRTTS